MQIKMVYHANHLNSMQPKQRGMIRPKLDHRDRDYLKSFHPQIVFGNATVPQFPDAFTTDAGLWMPNQDAVNPQFPSSPPEPNGCTNFTTMGLASDLDNKLYDPYVLEQITHANQLGGFDIRDSLMAAKTAGFISGFYNIQAYAPLDSFDAIRLAAFSGLPEKRSVSMGTPWYSDWQAAVETSKITMPTPATLDYTGLPWHNWKVGGWETINGIPYLRATVWEGLMIGDQPVGDKGWLRFDRPTVNAVMTANKYTVAYTATHTTPTTVYKIDMNTMDIFISFLRTLTGLRY